MVAEEASAETAVDSKAAVAADAEVSRETVADSKEAAEDLAAIEAASVAAEADSEVAEADTPVASIPTSRCPRPQSTPSWCNSNWPMAKKADLWN